MIQYEFLVKVKEFWSSSSFFCKMIREKVSIFFSHSLLENLIDENIDDLE